jgi:5-methylcytosine-specific restriction endonuclease McrA
MGRVAAFSSRQLTPVVFRAEAAGPSKGVGMRRLFSRRQREHLAILSGGCCELCGEDLPDSFHGDHKLAFSKGGPTTLRNGQATCPRCNLRKGSRYEHKIQTHMAN